MDEKMGRKVVAGSGLLLLLLTHVHESFPPRSLDVNVITKAGKRASECKANGQPERERTKGRKEGKRRRMEMMHFIPICVRPLGLSRCSSSTFWGFGGKGLDL